MNRKAVVILGPTSSGKSDLAVRLAKKYNGEIISADSRQVYKGMNIGSGKITKKEMLGIPHHLLDVASPKTIFTADKFKKMSEKAMQDIFSKGRVPIICGGTGFYIRTLVDNITLPEVQPNKKLRDNLNKKSTYKLAQILQKLDSKRASAIDLRNRPRVIRAIEIAKELGKVPELQQEAEVDQTDKIIFLQIGIDTVEKELEKRVAKRLAVRFKKGMVNEVKKLHHTGVSWKRLEMFGLEYRNCALFLQGKMTKEKMIETLQIETIQYARRQMRWFRRDQRIFWLPLSQEKVMQKTIKEFLQN